MYVTRLLICGVLSTFALLSSAQQQAPDALVKKLADDVLESIKADKAIQGGSVQRVVTLVDARVMPYVDAERMTSLAVGRYWSQATPTQRTSLQDQFKTLLIRTYAGALSQVGDRTIVLKTMRGATTDPEVVVRTEVRGQGDPIQLDYRLEKSGDSWKIYDVNVLGVWLAENYRNSFAQEISASGIDGLIAKLAERNAGAGPK